jgi:CheY-like chemotaxis protein
MSSGAGMSAKRALIVDDSKSARMFLSRILEKYELDVDTTETAELAIDYLLHHRPDVIFMDHLMPGMDGFQALQAIKNNPQTATIPIMMYTSQEGELYLGQARALGAVGVLPKQIKQADVSKVLYQLHLVPDRRTSVQSSFRPLTVDPLDDTASATATTGTHASITDAALRAELAELRHGLTAHIDHHFERIGAELRALVHDARIHENPVPLPPAASQSWGWVVATLALAAAIISTMLWQREVNLHRAAPAAAAFVRPAAAAPTPPAARAAPAKADVAAAAGAEPIIEAVPFGEDPLGGVRFEKLSQLLYRLAAEHYSGVAEIKSFPGRFCLVGSAADGYSLAPDEMPFTKCDAVGNPREGAQPPAQRLSLPFANLLGEIRHSTRGALDVEVTSGDAVATVVPYPQVSPDLTAGAWNRAGSANNRIEIRLR